MGPGRWKLGRLSRLRDAGYLMCQPSRFLLTRPHQLTRSLRSTSIDVVVIFCQRRNTSIDVLSHLRKIWHLIGLLLYVPTCAFLFFFFMAQASYIRIRFKVPFVVWKLCLSFPRVTFIIFLCSLLRFKLSILRGTWCFTLFLKHKTVINFINEILWNFICIYEHFIPCGMLMHT